ncbi:MAG TPA: hypothetical protein VHQ45_20095 [Gemmatimonadaceae bacterium]|nr:hypothetical protein [Gemmatimonadaceae bacterium]
MRRLIILALALGLASCGGDPAGPAQTGPVSFTLVNAGAPLTGTVGERLPVALEVQARRAGEPAAGQIISFVVIEPECGQPFAGAATTNAGGVAREYWELGSTVGTCHMEVRVVDQETGEPLVAGTFTAAVQPGVADTVRLRGISVRIPAGDSVSLASLVARAVDRFGNETAVPTITATITDGTAHVAGGYIFAGSTEGTGAAQLQVGNLSQLLSIWVGVDLRTHTWRAQFSCPFPPNSTHPSGASAYADSVQWNLVTDRVRYYPPDAPGDTIATYVLGALGTVWASGTGRYFLADGTTLDVTEPEYRVGIRDFGPDMIRFSATGSAWPPGRSASGPTMRTDVGSATWTGGTWCPSWSDPLRTEPMTFTQLAP